jgi:A/G-specific adenine glycosylase
MLQQTQAARVEPIFEAFVDRFPTVQALAGASRADVVRAWEGLGYHRRAVALHEASRRIVAEHGGAVPSDPVVLRTLPGIGPYTASAVAAIAFGAPLAAVDTNVRRIVARSRLGAEPDEVPAATLGAEAQTACDPREPGAWNQAMMDLGREVCRTRPRCEVCPLAAACAFHAAGREGRPSGRRQPPFEGSIRQVRGAVLVTLRRRERATFAQLARDTGHPPDRLREALEGLARDGVVEPGPRGTYRLPV